MSFNPSEDLPERVQDEFEDAQDDTGSDSGSAGDDSGAEEEPERDPDVPDDIARTGPGGGRPATEPDSEPDSDTSDSESTSSDDSAPSPSEPPEDVQETIDRRRSGNTGVAGGRDEDTGSSDNSSTDSNDSSGSDSNSGTDSNDSSGTDSDSDSSTSPVPDDIDTTGPSSSAGSDTAQSPTSPPSPSLSPEPDSSESNSTDSGSDDDDITESGSDDSDAADDIAGTGSSAGDSTDDTGQPDSPREPPEDVQETIDRRESGQTGLAGGRDDTAAAGSSDDSSDPDAPESAPADSDDSSGETTSGGSDESSAGGGSGGPGNSPSDATTPTAGQQTDDLGVAIDGPNERVEQQAREFKTDLLESDRTVPGTDVPFSEIDSRAGIEIGLEEREGQRDQFVPEITDRGQAELQEASLEDEVAADVGNQGDQTSVEDAVETQTNDEGDPEVVFTDEEVEESFETSQQTEAIRQSIETADLPDEAPERIKEEIARRRDGEGTPAEARLTGDVQSIDGVEGVDDAYEVRVETDDGETVERNIALTDDAAAQLQNRQREQQAQLEDEFERSQEIREQNREATAGIRERQQEVEARAQQEDIRRAQADQSAIEQNQRFGFRQEVAQQASEDLGADVPISAVDVDRSDGEVQASVDEDQVEDISNESGQFDTLPDEFQAVEEGLAGAGEFVSENVAEPAGEATQVFLSNAGGGPPSGKQVLRRQLAQQEVNEGDYGEALSTLAGEGSTDGESGGEAQLEEIASEENAAERFAEGVGSGAVEVANVPAIGSSVLEGVDLTARGVEEAVSGDGDEYAGEVGGAAATAAANLAESARNNPAQFAGSLVGSTVASAGTLTAARKLGGARAERAAAFGIQPGEEIAITAGRSVVPTRVATKVPGVKRSQIEGGRSEVVEAPEPDQTLDTGGTERATTDPRSEIPDDPADLPDVDLDDADDISPSSGTQTERGTAGTEAEERIDPLTGEVVETRTTRQPDSSPETADSDSGLEVVDEPDTRDPTAGDSAPDTGSGRETSQEPIGPPSQQVGSAGRDQILDPETVDAARGVSGPSRRARARGSIERRLGLDQDVTPSADTGPTAPFEDFSGESETEVDTSSDATAETEERIDPLTGETITRPRETAAGSVDVDLDQFGLSGNRGQAELVGLGRGRQRGRTESRSDTETQSDFEPSRSEILEGSTRDQLSTEVGEQTLRQRQELSQDVTSPETDAGRTRPLSETDSGPRGIETEVTGRAVRQGVDADSSGLRALQRLETAQQPSVTETTGPTVTTDTFDDTSTGLGTTPASGTGPESRTEPIEDVFEGTDTRQETRLETRQELRPELREEPVTRQDPRQETPQEPRLETPREPRQEPPTEIRLDRLKEPRNEPPGVDPIVPDTPSRREPNPNETPEEDQNFFDIGDVGFDSESEVFGTGFADPEDILDGDR